MKLKANNYLNCKYISHILILMPQFGKRERLSTAPRAPLSFMTKPFNCLAASHCSSPLQHRLDSQRQLSKQTPSLNWLHWPPLHILPVLWSLLHQSLSFFFFLFLFGSLSHLSRPCPLPGVYVWWGGGMSQPILKDFWESHHPLFCSRMGPPFHPP